MDRAQCILESHLRCKITDLVQEYLQAPQIVHQAGGVDIRLLNKLDEYTRQGTIRRSCMMTASRLAEPKSLPRYSTNQAICLLYPFGLACLTCATREILESVSTGGRHRSAYCTVQARAFRMETRSSWPHCVQYTWYRRVVQRHLTSSSTGLLSPGVAFPSVHQMVTTSFFALTP